MHRIKSIENELHDNSKVDRGLSDSWFVEVQRTKVNNRLHSSIKQSFDE